jgi:hypothetical protein
MNLQDITFEQLEEVLPHGSGIDSSWHFDRLKNGSIICSCSYHGMDQNGMYDGWQDFYVKLFSHKKDRLNPLFGPSLGKVQVLHRKGDIDFSVHFTGYRHSSSKSWMYGLKDYLEESIHYALSEAKILTNRHEVLEAKELANNGQT